MSRLSAFTLTALTLLAAACSDPRCPKGRVQDGQYCRRCPDGSEPKHNLCLLTDGGGVVDPIEEGEEDAGGDTEDEEDASATSDAAAGASDASMDAGSQGADSSGTTTDASSDSTDTSIEADASSDGDASAERPDAEAGVVDAGPPCYADKDKDGVGAGSPVSCEGYGTDAGAGLSLTNNDCDDNNDKRSPSLSDVCGDNIDNDCDGTPDDESNNACGGPCTTQLAHQPGEKCDNGLKGACAKDGAWQCSGKTATVCNAPSVAAGQEVCGDGVDNDCDGSKDEADAIDARTWYRDCDGDGYPSTVSIASCSEPAATASCANWVTAAPIAKLTEDCDDSRAEYHPGQTYGFPPDAEAASFDLNCDGIVELRPTVFWPCESSGCLGTWNVAEICDRNATCEDCWRAACSMAVLPDCVAAQPIASYGCSRSQADKRSVRLVYKACQYQNQYFAEVFQECR